MIYFITRFLVWVYIKLLYALKIKDAGKIPAKGPFIIASNHASYLDPQVVAVSSRRVINFMAKRELFNNKLFGFYLKKLRVFPLNRSASDHGAMREAARRLRKGGGLMIFPEGTRTLDNTLGEAKIGISILSHMGKAPVVPCYISGTYDIWPPGQRLPGRGRITITYGEIIPAISVGADKKKDYYEFAQRVMSSIKRLKEGIDSGKD